MTKKKEDKSVEQPVRADILNYRYVCDGCTNTALVTSNKMVGVIITCVFCGKQQITRIENFVI